MYYILYETTNLINGKKYRGVHKTKNLNDGYLGSGVLLTKAIRKYGKQNFSREILVELFSYEEMIEEEKYVDHKWVFRRDTYNLETGGISGREWSNEAKTKHKLRMNSPETKKRLCEAQKKLQNTPKRKNRAREIMNELWGNSEFRHKQKRIMESLEFKVKQSRGISKSWEKRDRESFSDKMRGKNHKLHKSFVVGCRQFDSLDEASKVFGVTRMTISNRLKSKTKKWKDWVYL